MAAKDVALKTDSYCSNLMLRLYGCLEMRKKSPAVVMTYKALKSRYLLVKTNDDVGAFEACFRGKLSVVVADIVSR